MKILFSTALSGALCAAASHAGTAPAYSHPVPFTTDQSAEMIWLAQGNSGKGNGNKGAKADKGKSKADKPKKTGKPDKAAKKDRGNNGQRADKSTRPPKADKPDKSPKIKDERRALTDKRRNDLAERLFATPAPDGRDMTALLGAATLGLLGSDVVFADIPENQLYTYRNCPPGLAKKDPPCVPPGLAKQGVGYQEWISYDDARLNDLWLDRRRQVLDTDLQPDADLLLLRSDQIATLYALDPAPAGQRYALIDGVPVLLDDEDYRSLLIVNQLAQVPLIGSDTRIAPTAALTQSELSRLYGLPIPQADQNYSVLNGQLVQLTDSQYETLQLIRIARAVL